MLKVGSDHYRRESLCSFDWLYSIHSFFVVKYCIKSPQKSSGSVIHNIVSYSYMNDFIFIFAGVFFHWSSCRTLRSLSIGTLLQKIRMCWLNWGLICYHTYMWVHMLRFEFTVWCHGVTPNHSLTCQMFLTFIFSHRFWNTCSSLHWAGGVHLWFLMTL